MYIFVLLIKLSLYIKKNKKKKGKLRRTILTWRHP